MPLPPALPRRTVIAGVLATGAAVLCAGCEDSTPRADASSPADGGTVTVGLDTDPDSQFDIHVAGADVSAQVMRNVVDSLLVQDPDGTFRPWLATSWDLSEDGLTYTFHLRKGVTFSDGETFDAHAAVTNLDRVVAPETKSQYAASLLGGEAYAGARALDDHTLELRLTQPFAPLLQGLSTAYLGFLAPDVLKDEKATSRLAAGGADVSIGTGPWTFTEYVSGQHLILSRNPDYAWGPDNATHTGPVRPERLVYQILPESSVRVGSLTSGELDVAASLSPMDVSTLEDDPDTVLTSADSPGLPWSLFLNHTQGPFRDRAVRRAVQSGLNISPDVAAVFEGRYHRAWSVVTPPTPDAYDDSLENSWTYDPDGAKNLLEDAGWHTDPGTGYRSKDGEPLTVHWSTSSPDGDQSTLMAAFQADLKKIGVELVIDQQDTGRYLQRLMSGDYDIVDWSFVRPDGDILRLHLFSKLAPVQNASWVDDPQIDDWVIAASGETDPAQRQALYAKVQQWVVRDAAIIPVYVPGNITATAAHLGGLRADITGSPLLYDTWTTAKDGR